MGIWSFAAPLAGGLFDFFQFGQNRRDRQNAIRQAGDILSGSSNIWRGLEGDIDRIMGHADPSIRQGLSQAQYNFGQMVGEGSAFRPTNFDQFTYDPSDLEGLGQDIASRLREVGAGGLGAQRDQALSFLGGYDPSGLVNRAQGIFDDRINLDEWESSQRAARLGGLAMSDEAGLTQQKQAAIANALRGGGGLDEASADISANEFNAGRARAATAAGIEGDIQGQKLAANTSIANTLAQLAGQEESNKLARASGLTEAATAFGLKEADLLSAMEQAAAQGLISTGTTADSNKAANLNALLGGHLQEQGNRIADRQSMVGANAGMIDAIRALSEYDQSFKNPRIQAAIASRQGLAGNEAIRAQLLAEQPWDFYSFGNLLQSIFGG